MNFSAVRFGCEEHIFFTLKKKGERAVCISARERAVFRLPAVGGTPHARRLCFVHGIDGDRLFPLFPEVRIGKRNVERARLRSEIPAVAVRGEVCDRHIRNTNARVKIGVFVEVGFGADKEILVFILLQIIRAVFFVCVERSAVERGERAVDVEQKAGAFRLCTQRRKGKNRRRQSKQGSCEQRCRNRPAKGMFHAGFPPEMYKLKVN